MITDHWVTDILRAEGMCGVISDDGRLACLLDRDHEGPHGFEAQQFDGK